MARTRSEASRGAILGAALLLARRDGFGVLTADALAAEAGVGKQTIYRWWRSLGEVVLEALSEHARTIEAPCTGTLEGDLAAFLRATFRALRAPDGTARVLRGLMAEAQLDEAFAPAFHAFVAARREVLRGIVRRHVAAERREIDASVDMIFGAMWYRLLVGHAALDAAAARTLAVLAARAARPARPTR